MKKFNPKTLLITGICVISFIFIFLSSFIVKEGYVGIVMELGKAERIAYPGLNFKIPLINTVEEIEIRQRKMTAELKSATSDQLSITSSVSINWTVNKNSEMQLFIDYGSLKQFEERILAPKLNSAGKSALAKFSAEALIKDRNKATDLIFEEMKSVMKNYPITINSPQIENIALPQEYLNSVLEKEKAKQDVERERQILEKQNLQSQQRVNTANAERDAIKAEADGKAYAIETEAKAKAQAIEILNKQLKSSENYIDFAKIEKWNGVLPQTMLGGSENILLPISK